MKVNQLSGMMKVEISVIMAVYNTDFPWVQRAIDSVMQQDFQDFELIVVDDGSDLAKSSQLLSYVSQHEDRITYLRHQNKGQSHAINSGVKLAQGNYITILDADDEYMPHHLSGCLQQLKDADLIASTTHTVVGDEEDYFVPDRHDQSKLVHIDDCILFATLFGKKEVFLSIGFEETYAADAHFYESASTLYKVKKTNLRSYIYYRNIADSKCSMMKLANLKRFSPDN